MNFLRPTASHARPERLVTLSSSIKRSWERCADVSYDLHTDPDPMLLADLQLRREQHAHLLELAQPELETLAGLVASAKSVVLLADAAGVILQEAGSTEFLHKAERVALRPGVSWAESLRGTNAIGTALFEGAPIRVHGSEHFLSCNRILSCHAAPIRSPRGDVIGVLDISGDAATLHAYALGLASLCATQIANRLLDYTDHRLHRLVFQRQTSLLDSAERAIVLIEHDRIVGANEAALHLLDTDWRLLDSPVDDWVDGWSSLAGRTDGIRTRSGQALVGQLHRGQESLTAQASPQHARPRPTPLPVAPQHIRTASAPLPELEDTAKQALLQAVAAMDGGMAVLLQGETGAGKEIFARHLHANSAWHRGPFVAINCGALPESLIESELFGYEGGAFTGARREGAQGRLREAQGGMLFLDEIGDMPLALQTRLLRALQEREVQPLGSDKRVPVHFGLTSASNRDLSTLITQGLFRADLYYRLQDYTITLSPLRERPRLREFLCAEFKRLGGTERGMTLSDAALDALEAYGWPGNYRQMQSLLRSLVVLQPAGSLIRREDLPLAQTDSVRAPIASEADSAMAVVPSGDVPAATLRDMTERTIEQVVRECGYNVSQAATVLGVHRSTLYRHLARLKSRDAGPG